MSGIAGVRLARSGPLVWAACESGNVISGSLCLLRTPEGERSARVIVAPDQFVPPVPPAPGYAVVRALTDTEALEVEPASGLRERAEGAAGFRASPSPDGGLVTLTAAEPESGASTVPPELLETDAAVVVRDDRGRIPAPELPELLEEIRYGGEAWTVTRVSVFRGEVELTTRDGRTAVVPLDTLPRRQG